MKTRYLFFLMIITALFLTPVIMVGQTPEITLSQKAGERTITVPSDNELLYRQLSNISSEVAIASQDFTDLLECHNISLRTGVQFISTYINPVDVNFKNIMSPVLSCLKYAKNSAGAQLSKVGPNWVNGIGNWIPTEGYLVSMNCPATLSICGNPPVIPFNTPIALSEKKIVPYLHQASMNASSAFSNIMPDLKIVKNSQGKPLMKIGPNWINHIGNCNPGEGYLVTVNAATTLIYPDLDKTQSSYENLNKGQSLTHFSWQNGGDPSDFTWTIFIDQTHLNGLELEVGDEIAIFDGAKIVGGEKLDEVPGPGEYNVSLIAFKKLGNGASGYTPGNPITFKLWKTSLNLEIVLSGIAFENPYGDAWVGLTFPVLNDQYSIIGCANLPEVFAGADATVCCDESYTIIDAVALNFSWLQWLTTNGTGFFDDETVMNPTYFPSSIDCDLGSVELCVMAYPNFPCTIAAEDCMILTFQDNPTVTAGPDATICQGSSYTVNAAMATNYSSLQWTTTGSGTFSSTGALTPVYTPATADYGEFVYLCVEAQPINPCVNTAVDCMELLIQENPVVDAGPDLTICENTGIAVIDQGWCNFTSFSMWSTTGDGSFNGAMNICEYAEYLPGPADLAAGSVTLVLIGYPLNPCTLWKIDYLQLSIQALPIADAGEDATIAENETYTLSGTAENYNAVMWTTTGDGTFNNPELLSSVYTPGTNDKLIGGVILCLTANPISPCVVNDDDCMTLTIENEITVYAGPDDTVCVETMKKTVKEDGFYQLHGEVTGAYTSVQWTTSGNGYFNNDAILDPTYTYSLEDILEGFVILSLNIYRKGPSSNYSDSMVLTFQGSPTADAGPDASICCGDSYTFLDATASNYASLQWITTNGTGYFDTETMINPTYFPGPFDCELGSVEICVAAYPISPCTIAAEGCMMLMFQDIPTVSAGVDGTICQGSSYTLSTAMATNYSSLQWTTTGSGTFSSTSSLTPVYSPATADYGEFVYLCLEAQPINPCVNTAVDCMELFIQENPVVDAGPDLTVCKDAGFVVIDQGWCNFTSFSMWLTTGDGSFNGPRNICEYAEYIPGPADLNAGSVTLVLRGTPLNPCTLLKTDSMQLSFQRIPTVIAGFDATINEDENYNLSGGANNCTSMNWTTYGDGTFDHPTILNPTYSPGSFDILSGGVELCLVAYPISPCVIEAEDCMTLTILSEIIVDAGPDDTICAEGGKKAPNDYGFYQLNGVIIGPYISFMWVTPDGTGYFDNEMILNPRYYYSGIDILLGQIEIILLVERKGTKSNYMDSMILTFQQSPSADAGPDASICCGDSYTFLDATASNYTSLQWITTNGTGYFDTETMINPTYFPGPFDCELGSIEICVAAYPISPCSIAAEDCMTLIIQTAPTVNAGSDVTINGSHSVSYTVAEATAENYSSLQWTTSGDGIFDDETSQNPTYILGPEDFTSCEVQLCVTAYPFDPCIVATDCMILTIFSDPPSQQPLGSGTEADPYLIDNLQNLYWISEQADNGVTFSGVYFLQTADIDASETANWFCGLGWNPIGGSFYGNYNGGCHVIESLHINRENEDYVGLFGTIRTGKIEKLKVLDFHITGNSYVGALAGRIRDNSEVEYVDVENVHIQLFDLYGGGLTGLNYSNSRIYRCSSSGQVTRGNLNSYNSVGGFVGAVGESAIVEECYSTAEVVSLNHRRIGGFVGLVGSQGIVKNSYSRGPVTASGQRVGGFSGEFAVGSISNCFSTGLVYSPFSYVGGFNGLLGSGLCTANFWDTQTSNQTTSSCAEGKTSADMKTQSTFTDAGWDFENIWAMDGVTNDGYPALQWQLAPVVFAGVDASYCCQFYIMDGAMAMNYSSPLWTTSGDGYFNNTTILNPEYHPGPQDRNYGIIDLCLTVYPIDPCEDAVTDCMTLHYFPYPEANAGPDVEICGCEPYTIIHAEAANYTQVLWTIASGTGYLDFDDILSPTYYPSQEDCDQGNIELCLHVFGFEICPPEPETDCMIISYVQPPVADAGADATINEGDAYTLSGSALYYAGVDWTTGGDGDFDPPDILTPLYTPGPQDILAGVVELCLTAYPINPCVVNDDDCMILNIEEEFYVDAGPDDTVCTEGGKTPLKQIDCYQKTGASTNLPSFCWITSGDGYFENDYNIINPVYCWGVLDILNGSVTLTITVCKKSNSKEISDSMVLTFQPGPDADAGPDATICEDGSYALADATASDYQVLQWFTMDGLGMFSNETMLNPTYYPSPLDIATGCIHLGVIATPIAPCTVAATDEMELCFRKIPTAYAGPDATICCGDSYTFLEATTSNSYSLQWFTTNGTGSFDNENLLNSTYNFSQLDCDNSSVEFCLTANPIDPCTVSAIDCMTITLQNPPFAYAGEDATYCCQYYTMGDAIAMHHSSSRWTTSGDGTFSSTTILHPDYYPGPQDRNYGIITLCLTVYPIYPCDDTITHCMILNYYPYPKVALGADTAVCGCEPFTLTQATASDYSELFWSTSGSGTFSQNTILHPVYYPTPDDCANGSVDLCLSAIGIPPCSMSVNDCMILTIYPPLVVNCPNDFSVCIDEPVFTLTGATPAGGTYGGPGVSNGKYFIAADAGTGAHLIIYSYWDPWCGANICGFYITVVPTPTVDAGPDVTIDCSQPFWISNAYVANCSGVEWSTNGDGFFDDNTLFNPTYYCGPNDMLNCHVVLCIKAYPIDPPCTEPVTDCMTITCNNCPPTQCSIYGDDYSSSSLWTQIGTKVVIAGGVVQFNNIPGHEDHRVFRSIPDYPQGLGTRCWIADFDFHVNDDGNINNIGIGEGAALFCLSSEDFIPMPFDPTSSDMNAIIVSIGGILLTPDFHNTTTINVGYKQGTGPIVPSVDIPFPQSGWNSTYYARLERSDPTLAILSVFSDHGRTTHIPGSPTFLSLPYGLTLTGSNSETFLQHASVHQAGTGRHFDGWVDSTCINTCCFAANDPQYVRILSNTTYTTNMIWDGKMYIDDGVTVTVDGHLLDITIVDVVFGRCAGIEFVNGGYLRANNSVFRPCNIDETWKGLHFIGGENDSIMVNECTFKNAEAALYFQDTADAVISNNLFSNCNYGIRVEGNNNFDHPITGNQFVTDQFFPDFDECGNKYDFVNNYSTYGIYSSQSRFLYQLSQNKFINSKGNSPNTYGIYQKLGGGIFSENIFTDLFYSVYLHSQQFYSCIENNEIEVKLPAMNNPSIRINSCQGAIVEVNNNEIWNNYNQNVGWAAIYADYSSNVSIVNNQIDGFNYGIVSLYNQKCQISNNEINDCQTGGIIIYEQTYNKSYITCNTIKMKNYDYSTGLAGRGMSSQSEISSNCITDCRVSMEFRRMYGVTFPPLPKIRNNFLYNYNFVGINVANLSGNIGTLTDPGLNTLWSNKNAARDINSNTNITVADNFGMFNISWPQVQIVSNNPYHSTASCGHQIFNMPSQGQLNVNYTCDHFSNLVIPLTGDGGLFYLSSDYRETLKSSSNQYDDASIILANYNSSDINLLNEIVDLTLLSENEKALLRYNFYYRNADYQNAQMHLNHFSPTNTDEEDFKTLRLYDLDIIGNGMGILSENDLEILRSIQDKKPEYSNFATSILNNSPTYTAYKIEEITVEDVVISGDVKHIENDESFLHIYPNPFSNTVFIELINNNSETSKLELFDMTGKLVTNYTINFVAGVIELDMQKLNEGLYFITLTDPNSGFIQKGKMVKVKN